MIKIVNIIHLVAIETDSYMKKGDKPFLGITHGSGHANLGNYLGELNDDAVLECFEVVLNKNLEYKGKLEFVENIKPVVLKEL